MPRKPDPPDIEIIATGGNFARHVGKSGVAKYENIGENHTSDLLADALGPSAAIRTLFLKDSSTFSDDDHRLITEAVRQSPFPRIVLLHGTTTLDVTARFLFQMGLKKTIIVTGTTKPFETRSSEAFFNLGAAIGLVQALPDGVYGVMNGRIISPMSLRKDPETGRFDTASGGHMLSAKE